VSRVIGSVDSRVVVERSEETEFAEVRAIDQVIGTKPRLISTHHIAAGAVR